jgi:(hydroxyamino)benzene mutase
MDTTNRRLMWHGMFLFLLGLLTGFVEQRFTNVRMGLAAHLEGVMNGTLLVALGAIWPEVRLPRAAKATAYWTALYATSAPRLFLHSRLQATAAGPGRRVLSQLAS